MAIIFVRLLKRGMILLIIICLDSCNHPSINQLTPTAKIPASGIQGVTDVPISGQSTLSTAPSLTPQGSRIPVSLPDNLEVEEYTLKSKPQLDPLSFEVTQGSTAEVLKKHQVARSMKLHLSDTNDKLGQFGYSLTPVKASRSYILNRNQRPFLQNIESFGKVSINTSGTDFVIVIITKDSTVLVSKAHVTQTNPWEASHNIFAVFLGDDLLIAQQVDIDGFQVQVTQAGKTIFMDTSIPAGYRSVATPLQGLWVDEGHWYLEVGGEVFLDGESLNRQYDYTEVFHFQLIHGHPFYFFNDGTGIGVSYNHQILPLRYTEIPHYECCSAAELNPVGRENIVAFFAQRQGIWSYVEISVFP
ncbi:MAG: hypothetical protein PHQ40_12675 [Anaerolineaceae bacterium]|nr:hypothetical protein [Anaerolineaceae bacterium]